VSIFGIVLVEYRSSSGVVLVDLEWTRQSLTNSNMGIIDIGNSFVDIDK